MITKELCIEVGILTTSRPRDTFALNETSLNVPINFREYHVFKVNKYVQ